MQDACATEKQSENGLNIDQVGSVTQQFGQNGFHGFERLRLQSHEAGKETVARTSGW
jgi:hypothetical protein